MTFRLMFLAMFVGAIVCMCLAAISFIAAAILFSVISGVIYLLTFAGGSHNG